MSDSTTHCDLDELRTLSRLERQEALEVLVLGQFRTALLMSEDEDLPMNISYFDMGLTSLRLTAIRQSLENVLDIAIDATVLFNRPTLDDLVTYLGDLVSTRGGSRGA
jgi:acyl carrier protein